MVELSQNLLAELGGWPAMKEARGLVERGRVREARREGPAIRATVQGAEKSYEPQIVLADRVANVEVRCTCAESRRSGRVCAHALAAGLALLSPQKTASPVAATVPSSRPAARAAISPPAENTSPPPPKRFPIEEAPLEIPKLEITVLLPLQLRESLAKEPVRIILEARNLAEEHAQPFDAVVRGLGGGFAVSEEDERVLGALEKSTGTASGLNAVTRGKIAAVLRALSGHPRVWLGKKQRVEVRAAAERARVVLSRQSDGALELRAGTTELREPASSHVPPGMEEKRTALPIAHWFFDGATLTETPALPPGFTGNTRLIPPPHIPDFLARELPLLERTCDLVFSADVEEFQMEIGRPTFAVRLDGALSGLTLELFARYGAQEFPLHAKTESSAYQRYFPAVPPAQNPVHRVHPAQNFPSVFWRRNILAERAALAEIEAASFGLVRAGATTYSLTHENQVARFLANTLPRWRRMWAVQFGARLEATMAQVDIAEPEFALRRGSGEDWLSLDLQLSVRGQPVPLDPAEIQRWLQTGQSHARTANQRVLLVPTEAWGEMKEVLADCEVEQEPGQIRVARTFAPFLSGALTAQGFRGSGEIGKTRPPSEAAMQNALGPALWSQLRPYQAQGVAWLAGLAQQNFHGLLADDMGLGKTLQALAFAAWVRSAATSAQGPPPRHPGTGETKSRPMLVVCPTSLVTNWGRETARFTPHLRALDLTGSDRAKKWARRGDYDLLVTSYAILRRDIESYRADEFALVILDEAQHIKNRASQNAQSAKALRARHRLILTGTPLENSVLDLWSLYDFLLPGYLGPAADFRERYETPLTKQPEPKVMERLRQRVRPFFLRRTREEVLTELPPKLEFPTLCELSDEQREVYRAVLAQGRREVFEHSGKAGRNAGRDRMAVLTTLLRLRQVCCHLDLLPAGDAAAPHGGATAATSRWKEPSAKMERTFELIDEAIDGGHRVLLFSQFVRVLHLLRDEAKRRELRFCYLDGQTVERQVEVDRFQQDAGIPLFFISLKAGGTGLNLTGADTVIHFDPWWNPAVEEQATARAHRMGQARRVSAYKLIAAGTVEEKIQALQARKRELFEASLGGDAALVEKLTGEDLEDLLAD